MSARITYIICIILFIVLVVLLVAERQNPEGGAALLQNLIH